MLLRTECAACKHNTRFKTARILNTQYCVQSSRFLYLVAYYVWTKFPTNHNQGGRADTPTTAPLHLHPKPSNTPQMCSTTPSTDWGLSQDAGK